MRSIVAEIVSESNALTLMDMEASIEHLSRGTVRHVDALLIVVEPYYRALETAGRIAPLARGLGIPRLYAVANKTRASQDAEAVKEYCRNHDLQLIATVPFDQNVTEADRTGRAIIDYDAASPIVEELMRLADFLEREIFTADGEAGGTQNA